MVSQASMQDDQFSGVNVEIQVEYLDVPRI